MRAILAGLLRSALCKLGIHIYGHWQQTRWNPALDLFTYHRHCACGLAQSRLIDGRIVPKDWSSMKPPKQSVDYSGRYW